MDKSKEISQEKLEELYLQSFSERERQGYLIAKDHLGMSYRTDKSIGFNEWKNKFFEKK